MTGLKEENLAKVQQLRDMLRCGDISWFEWRELAFGDTREEAEKVWNDIIDFPPPVVGRE